MTNRHGRTAKFLFVTLMLLAAGAGRLFAADPFGDPRTLKYPPLHPIQVPEPTRKVVAGGIIVYLLEDHDFPVVDARALIHVGSMYEPSDKVGLARLTGEVMRTGGSVSVSGDSLDRALEGLGASVEISIGDTQGSASVSTLSEDLPTGLSILADLLRNPALPEEKLELAKTAARTSIAGRNDEMMSILMREFPKLVLGTDHPYARHTEYSTIDAISRQDLVGFHRAYFHPDRMILTIFGDFETAKVLPLLDQVFQGWAPAAAPLPPDPPMPSQTRPGVYFANKADATNTGILMGHLGLRMDDPDYPAMMLLNEVLGGGFSGRLVNEIRTKRGLAYSTGSNPGAGMHHPGSLSVYAMTQTDSSAATTGYLKNELRRVLSSPVGAEEISRAREGILNSLVFTLSSKGAVLNRLAEYEYYGYPRDFLQKYQEAIQKLTPEDLLATAKRRIRPQEMVTLLVGNGEKVRPQLAAVGQVNEVDIAIPDASVPSAGGAAAVPAPTPADFERGQALLERAAKATFPKGAGALKDLTVEETGKIFLTAEPFNVTSKKVRLFPDCDWSEQELPFGLVTTTRCRDQVWARTPAGVREFSSEEMGAAVRERERDLLAVLMDPKRLKAHALPGETPIGNFKADVVAVDSEIVKDWKIYLDRETGRILRVEFTDRVPQGGAPGQIQIEYRDYKPIQDLIWWPHLTERVVQSKPFVRLETTSVAVNSSPDPAIFQKPTQ